MRIGLIVVLMFFAVKAVSEEDYWDLYNKCMDNLGAPNNGNVGYCTSIINEMTAKRIDFLIAELKPTLDEIHLNKLSSSQEAWQIYKDNQCDLQGIYIGSPMFSYCRMTMSIERILRLNMFFD